MGILMGIVGAHTRSKFTAAPCFQRDWFSVGRRRGTASVANLHESVAMVD